MLVTQAKKIVYIGDSITEWGRFDDPDNLGQNYVRFIHDYLKITYPGDQFECINKGIGGNRIIDLADRWEEDVIQLRPDIVSISIGINDVWRQIDQPDMEQVNADEFKRIYNDLIKQVKEKTNAQIVLMEPTIIGEQVSPDGNHMLNPYVEIVQKLAIEHETIIVHTHKVFLKYLEKGDYPLTIDGVHMNSVGNMLMAKAWLQTAMPLLDECLATMD